MRKMMSKEVTFTVLKVAKMELGQVEVVTNEKEVTEGAEPITKMVSRPVIVELPNEVILGTINPDKAQKYVNKKHKTNVTIFDTEVITKVFEMAVSDFIKVATIRTDDAEETDDTDDDEIETETEPTPETTPKPTSEQENIGQELVNNNRKNFRTY